MRLKLSRFRRNFNKDLPIEFTEQNLSSFGGLELFSRYLRRVELSRRVGKACRGKGIRSDYGSVRLVLVLVGMLLVGARRLEHLQYVCDDPMLLRFCGLRRLPSRPTIVNWLKQKARVVVDVVPRRRKPLCGVCGRKVRKNKDRYNRYWRHLDLFGVRSYLRYSIRRVVCRRCGVVKEKVPSLCANIAETLRPLKLV